VKVIKLISKDSIEDNLLRLGQKKLKLEQDMTATDAIKQRKDSGDIYMMGQLHNTYRLQSQ
jgi:SNF2 family DNA or RNA helicase